MRIILLFLFISSALAAPKWSFHRKYGAVEIFKSLSTGTRLVLEYKTTTKVFDMKNKEKFYQKLAQKKKKVLAITGVHDWKADSYAVEEKKSFKILTIDGSYFDNNKRKIYFREVHYYGKGRFLQLLATNKNKENLKRSLQDNSLSGFKVKYGFSH